MEQLIISMVGMVAIIIIIFLLRRVGMFGIYAVGYKDHNSVNFWYKGYVLYYFDLNVNDTDEILTLKYNEGMRKTKNIIEKRKVANLKKKNLLNKIKQLQK